MNKYAQAAGATFARCSPCYIRTLHRFVFTIGERKSRGQNQSRGMDYRWILQLSGAVFFLLACGTKSMTISWQDTSTNEQGFRIYRITNQQKIVLAEVGANIRQYTDPQAPRDACYIVTAFNAAGESSATNSACRQQ